MSTFDKTIVATNQSAVSPSGNGPLHPESFPLLAADRSLESLAAIINKAHAEAQQHASMAVERAFLAGDTLLTVKAQVAHGQWLPWLKTHCPAISIRTVQDYMRVARKLPPEKRSAAHLSSVREALRLVAGEPEPPALEHQPDIMPFWWEGHSPEENSAWCADRDLLVSAALCMDADGITAVRIAMTLGVPLDAIERAISPRLPLLSHWGDEDHETIALRTAIYDRAAAMLAFIRASDYEDASRAAVQCGRADMASGFNGMAQYHRRRAERDQFKDPITFIVGLRLVGAAVGAIDLSDSCGWLEVGRAGNAIDQLIKAQSTEARQ